MKNMGIVQGSAEQAIPLVIGKDTVYVHTNIEQLPSDDERKDVVFQYQEIQYEKDEYIFLITKQITDTQLALCEIYERMI
jgi:hypothetical protein